MDQEYLVKISGFAYGGEAIGRLDDGQTVFVPFALPSETVRIKLVEEKRSFARARLLEVVSPAAERITPVCAHFGVCGGCHYQHLPYIAQLSVKQTILHDQLTRVGGIANPPVKAMVASARPYYYRNHVQFHLTGDGKLGYHRWRSDAVFPLQECYLPQSTINQIWPQLDFETMLEIDRIGLREGVDQDVHLILESNELDTPDLSIEGLDISVLHLSPAGALVLAGSAGIEMEVLGRRFQVSAGSFFQVNTPVAEAMVSHIIEEITGRIPLTSSTTLIDGYCGVGLFSAFLAPLVGQLIGIEASPSACDDFAANLDEYDHVSLYEAPCEEVFPYLEARPQVILVDPPRAGLQRTVLDGLARLSAQVLVYVSCDPATLGRDAKRLQAAGYRLEQVTPFDLFPQTYHIESISFWVKSA